jgi:hypothetical protein
MYFYVTTQDLSVCIYFLIALPLSQRSSPQNLTLFQFVAFLLPILWLYVPETYIAPKCEYIVGIVMLSTNSCTNMYIFFIAAKIQNLG